jgi:hypothetical protein
MLFEPGKRTTPSADLASGKSRKLIVHYIGQPGTPPHPLFIGGKA